MAIFRIILVDLFDHYDHFKWLGFKKYSSDPSRTFIPLLLKLVAGFWN